MDDNSDSIKVEVYNKETLLSILENTNLFKVSHENGDIVFAKKEDNMKINFTINTINFLKPHFTYLKEEGIEFLGSEFFYIPYHEIKSLVVDSKNFIYASSLENERVLSIKELKVHILLIVSFLFILLIIVGIGIYSIIKFLNLI